jgi:hypothetical protein
VGPSLGARPGDLDALLSSEDWVQLCLTRSACGGAGIRTRFGKGGSARPVRGAQRVTAKTVPAGGLSGLSVGPFTHGAV